MKRQVAIRALPFQDRRKRVYHGWWIVAAGSINQAIINLTLARSFGAYAVLLESQFGWSKTALSAAYSLQQAENGILCPIQGWLIDRSTDSVPRPVCV